MKHCFPCQIIKYILSCSDHVLAGLSITSISERFGCEVSMLEQQFKKHQHLELSDYLSRERVYRAAYKIRKHDIESLLQLADALGFESPQKFSMEFKRFFCIEPERYYYLMEVKRFKQQLSIQSQGVSGIEAY